MENQSQQCPNNSGDANQPTPNQSVPNQPTPQYQQPGQYPPGYQPLQELPNGTLILIFGILSLPLSFCYGVLGLVFGIVTLVLAREPRRLYRLNPTAYSNYSNVQAGYVCAIIAVIIASLWMLFLIAYFLILGSVLGLTALN